MKSLDKALSVLELMIVEGRDLALTEISTKVGLQKGTVHRILSTMKARKFVQQKPDTKKYGFGIRAFELGSALKKEGFLRNAMMPTLRKLSYQCKEAINASILEYNEVRYIVHLESEELLRFSIREGTRLPAHCTAMGKVLLGSLSDQELKRIYGRKSAFKQLTENSIGSLDQLLEAISEVRKKNLAFDHEETLIGVCCVAAPIRNFKNEVVAAISISGPKERMQREQIKEFSHLLTWATEKISKALDF